MHRLYQSKRLLVLVAVVIALAALVPLAAFSGNSVTPVATESLQADVTAVQVQTATVAAPERVELQFTKDPPAMDAKKLAELEKAAAQTHLPGPALAVAKESIEGPDKGSETAIKDASSDASISAPGTFWLLRSMVVPRPSGYRSTISEPSVANVGRYVFYTTNWFNARSTDGGATWAYVNPFTDMAEFCCDQDVIKDPGRQILLWYRQGIKNSSGVNRFRLGVSANGGASWCFYNYYTTNLGLTGQWFDYPKLAVSNDYLYIASNVFNNANYWTRTVMLKWPLDALATCAGFGFSWINWTANFNFTPVNGATDTMYWASHQSTSVLRIFRWNEATGAAFYDRTIPAWTSTGRGSAICTTPDGRNPCARLDHRINDGWVSRRTYGATEVGFGWTVRQGAGFTYPYVNAARFRETDLAYLGRPYIYSQSFAFFYFGVSPNKRGDLGIATYLAGGGSPIRLIAGIDDDFNGVPPGWEVYTIRISTHGPASNGWGDYLRVRQHNPEEIGWILSGHTLQGGNANDNAEARYVVFTRERDRQSVLRWWGL